MIKKGRLIGRGRTAEVYELSADKVLKLYYPQAGTTNNHYEFEIGGLLKNAGAPAPHVYETACVEDREGLILEHTGDNCLFNEMIRRPWRVYNLTKRMARLHANIHQLTCPSLISQCETVKSKIKLCGPLLGKKADELCRYADSLPGGHSICHGDFHPKNIFNNARGDLAIDWVDISCGHPAGDVARTCIILASPQIPAGSTAWQRVVMLLKKIVIVFYLREYLHLTGLQREEINRWVAPLAAAKLMEGLDGERDWLLSIAEGRKLLKF